MKKSWTPHAWLKEFHFLDEETFDVAVRIETLTILTLLHLTHDRAKKR